MADQKKPTRTEQQEARRRQKQGGIKYTTALRQVLALRSCK